MFVTPQMHADIRVHAAQRGATMSEVVADAIGFWLATGATKQTETKPKKNGKRA